MLQLAYTMFKWYPIRSIIGIVILCGMLLLWLWARKDLYKDGSKAGRLYDLFFGIYICLVLLLTVALRHPDASRQSELSLLWSYKKAFSGNTEILLEIIENIILFIPLGLLLPIVFKRKFSARSIVIISLTISAVIEFLQYSLKLGLFEFDDILNNAIGGYLGYLLYKKSNRV